MGGWQCLGRRGLNIRQYEATVLHFVSGRRRVWPRSLLAQRVNGFVVWGCQALADAEGTVCFQSGAVQSMLGRAA